MKVVILAGGMGTRLSEETDVRPKPMVHIGDWPILWHIMKYYASYGHQDYVLSLGYMGVIKEYFWHYELMNNDVSLQLGKPESRVIHHAHDEAGWNITLADTGVDALKGARLKKVERHVNGDPFMVTYGDGLANVDLDQLVKFHRSHGKLATVTGGQPDRALWQLGIKGDTVTSFREKPRWRTASSTGLLRIRAGIFDYLTGDDDCDLESERSRRSPGGQLQVFIAPTARACMDTDRDRTHLNKLWSEGNAFWKRW